MPYRASVCRFTFSSFNLPIPMTFKRHRLTETVAALRGADAPGASIAGDAVMITAGCPLVLIRGNAPPGTLVVETFDSLSGSGWMTLDSVAVDSSGFPGGEFVPPAGATHYRLRYLVSGMTSTSALVDLSGRCL
jgi:hypothetical protein